MGSFRAHFSRLAPLYGPSSAPAFRPSSAPQLYAKLSAPVFGQNLSSQLLGQVQRPSFWTKFSVPAFGSSSAPQLLDQIQRPSFWSKLSAPAFGPNSAFQLLAQINAPVLGPSSTHFFGQFCNPTPLLNWRNRISYLNTRWPISSAECEKRLRNKQYRSFLTL